MEPGDPLPPEASDWPALTVDAATLADPDPARAERVPRDQDEFLKASASRQEGLIRFLRENKLIHFLQYGPPVPEIATVPQFRDLVKSEADRQMVDLISVGALTHSPRSLDSSLEWQVG